MGAICSLINSTSKLCRADERFAKGTFPTLSLEPFDSLVDPLATFRACHFPAVNCRKTWSCSQNEQNSFIWQVRDRLFVVLLGIRCRLSELY